MSRPRILGVFTFVAALFLSAIPVSVAGTAGGAEIAAADAVAASVNKVAPAEVDNPRMALAYEGATLKGSGASSTVTVPTNSTGIVTLASAGSGSARSLRVSPPRAARSENAVVASDGTVTFGSKGAGTGVAIQAFQ